MKVACHYPIPRPPHPRLDAAVQDGMHLVDSLGGTVNFLYPGSRARRVIPRFLCGFHQIYYLLQLDRQVDLHQVFSNGLYPYPILRLLRKPVVYTSVIEIGRKFPLLGHVFLSGVSRFVVVSNRDQQSMRSMGLDCEIIPPGIELDGFTRSAAPRLDRLVLLAGSAPWNEAQFETKGVDVLLRTAAELPWLHLVFLWRGRLLGEMRQRVARYALTDRVRILDEQVDVNKELKKVHAAIVLAENPELVKGYPHSLLEALAAGRPVLVSSCLAMAEYVRETGCGVSVPSLDLRSVLSSVEHLRARYVARANVVSSLDMQCFSVKSMVNAYADLYRRVLTHSGAGDGA